MYLSFDVYVFIGKLCRSSWHRIKFFRLQQFSCPTQIKAAHLNVTLGKNVLILLIHICDYGCGYVYVCVGAFLQL